MYDCWFLRNSIPFKFSFLEFGRYTSHNKFLSSRTRAVTGFQIKSSQHNDALRELWFTMLQRLPAAWGWKLFDDTSASSPANERAWSV